ncbi:RloB family protein [Streptomyces sp. NPDC004520]|uniref:RloB family protein n=1 Tax=Streptomyces sp. NPDC004520 TaxID=3364702 RepID=UPI0036B1F385
MSKRQIRGNQRISKSKRKREEYRKILITAEGVNTEPQYFERFAAFLKARAVRIVSVKPIGLGKDPLTVVKEADRRRRDERKSGDPFDEVWCVVDVDEHTNLERACVEAARLKIDIAISSPCFEIWLLWHFESKSSWVDAASLARALKKWGFTDKSIPPDFPYANYDVALGRAAKCDQIHIKHTPPNPSSSVPSLVAALVKSYTEEKEP